MDRRSRYGISKMVKKSLLILSLSGFVLFFPVQVFSASPFKQSSEQAEKKDIPIQVHGDSVEYFHTEQKVVGEGHVSIDYEDTRLTADKVIVYMKTKVAYAQGHVVLTQAGSVFTGNELEYDFTKKQGNVSKMTATIDPSYYGKAERIEKISDKHYRIIDGSITTCCGDDPLYRIQAHEVDIYPNEKVVVRNAVMTIKGTPVLFLPYFITYFVDFDRFPVQIIPGKNSQWGAFLLSKWRYHLADRPSFQSKGNILLDYRQKRGFGTGVENFYRGDKIGRGAIRLYYLDDDNPPENFDSERYRAQWRHQSKLTNDTTLTVELNGTSDIDVIKDFFFREEYERDAFPDNYVSLITNKPEYTLSFLSRHRLNDFYTVVERSPEVRFDTHNRSFANTPFYLRQEVQFSNLKKEYANSPGELDTVRFDANHTLSYAGRVGDVSVTPHIGTRQTLYSRNLGGEEASGRGIFDSGLDVSTRFYRTYDAYLHAGGLDYNQIRHIFTPTLSYNFRPNPTVSRTTLPQFDAIDALDKQNVVRFSFENKLQTKEHATDKTLVTREIARVIPFFDYDAHTGRFSNVGIDSELRPYTWLGIETDATYDPRTATVQTTNVDFYVTKGDASFGLGQRYLRDESSQTTVEFRWKINEEWSTNIYERYEFETNESKEFEITVSRVFSCIIVDFTYNHREGDTFYFAFRLKAFPTSSFGLSQSYNRPKASSRI